MPIYEYRCPTCGTIFERLLQMGSSAPSCPNCGRSSTEKLVSLIAGRVECGPSCACSGAT